jgi:hypothetical protein
MLTHGVLLQSVSYRLRKRAPGHSGMRSCSGDEDQPLRLPCIPHQPAGGEIYDFRGLFPMIAHPVFNQLQSQRFNPGKLQRLRDFPPP